MGSIFGKLLKISVFGESHGESIGVVIDGFPAGVELDMEFINAQLRRRRANKEAYSTSRLEADEPKLLSGVLNGVTEGTPICCVFENTNTKSQDYEALKVHPRPSHADITGQVRYKGFNDPRGGGHFSGRLTAPIVFAGALCQLYLKGIGVELSSEIKSIGTHEGPGITEEIKAYIKEIASQKDSVGGVVECVISGVERGIGSPIFDCVEAKLASILFSVPAVKGVEFGTGFDIARLRGSEANDLYLSPAQCSSNHNGGILGGITNGMPIVVRAAIKPTPSIGAPQMTWSTDGMKELEIKGRHDPCIVPRAQVVIETACAIAMTDLILEANGYA